MTASYRFVVSGRVQGVGFRYSAAAEARALGITGWVRNREDGAVEGVACGAADALERFRRWLARGPPSALVEKVEWSEAPQSTIEQSFAIRG